MRKELQLIADRSGYRQVHNPLSEAKRRELSEKLRQAMVWDIQLENARRAQSQKGLSEHHGTILRSGI